MLRWSVPICLNSVYFFFKLTMATPDLRTELVKYLESLNIQTVCVDHPPVRTNNVSKLANVS